MIFNSVYFFLAIALFIIEACIAAYVNDAFVRPFLGDTLVVMLLYCFIKAFFNADILKTTGAVLLIAYLMEFSQYLRLTELLGWSNSKIAGLLLGTSFSFIDIFMYTLGACAIIIIEAQVQKLRTFTHYKNERSVKK